MVDTAQNPFAMKQLIFSQHSAPKVVRWSVVCWPSQDTALSTTENKTKQGCSEQLLQIQLMNVSQAMNKFTVFTTNAQISPKDELFLGKVLNSNTSKPAGIV